MEFEIIAYIIIFSPDEKAIILCKDEKNNAYFLPGVKPARGKKIKHEIASFLKTQFKVETKDIHFLGIMENIFKQKGDLRHQYNLFFKVEDHFLPPSLPSNGCNFEWQSLPFPPSILFEPNFLKDEILRWLNGQEVFFSSTDEE